jgi:hypothetical protein
LTEGLVVFSNLHFIIFSFVLRSLLKRLSIQCLGTCSLFIYRLNIHCALEAGAKVINFNSHVFFEIFENFNFFSFRFAPGCKNLFVVAVVQPYTLIQFFIDYFIASATNV